jgi:uncharacterized protein
MIKIGIISDSHLRAPTPLLCQTIDQYFKETVFILHAGDITSLKVIEAFQGKEVIAVAGNRDSSRTRAHLPQKRVIRVERFRIGLIHGWGMPLGLGKRVVSEFEGIDCLVYGHSHWPVNVYRDGILYFNPGSFSGGIFSLWRQTIGLLTIDKDIRGEIIRLNPSTIARH